MSTTTLILGESGSGKSSSMRHMSPKDTLLIQVIRKRLPFRSPDWRYFHPETCRDGNIMVTDLWSDIIRFSTLTSRKRIVVDDFQYILANEFMRRSEERGYDKFTEIGRHTWEIFNALMALPDDKRIYLMSHTDTGDDGTVRMKTIGKMLNDKVTLEGLVTICLRSIGDGSNYQFATRTNGRDPCKTPIGMFADPVVENDLEAVDRTICDYYGIVSEEPPAADATTHHKKRGLAESSAATGLSPNKQETV